MVGVRSAAVACLIVTCILSLVAAAIPAEAPVAWDSVPSAKVAVQVPAQADGSGQSPKLQPTAAAIAERMAAAPAASKSFRATLSQAAEKAYRSGEITRWDLARIRLAISLRPKAIDECQACVTEEACAAGVMPMSAAGDGAFDWSTLAAFIKEWLPQILAIIKLFSV